ncbi:BgTH12-06434 [Blumeria graminis f. sp. triticale]|uniref:Bgt-2924 n=3 Tax=Blumeria graminis TaxID=34373 RepID=A0A061HD12_BLUGR|nr:Guanine nucleotide exchange factor (GEF) [Blumeria graminis f. sp. tritici 96224]CAD6500727.1 BgTH12-06434 [Blumeria graminis f. sp. triticale]VCU41005.1 Bgt-2924 [Blumeria graminis f. sp. tritici]
MPQVSGLVCGKKLSDDSQSRRRSLVSTESIGTISTSNSKSYNRSDDGYISREYHSKMSSRDSKAEKLSTAGSPKLVPEEDCRHKHFRKLKLRYASESQLSTKARLHAQLKTAPPVPQIINTATAAPVTEQMFDRRSRKKKSRLMRLSRHTSSNLSIQSQPQTPVANKPEDVDYQREETSNTESIGHIACVPFEAALANSQSGPPPYGDDSNSTLALPINRMSDSSRSDVSSGENGVYATTTTTHTVHTTTTFFRLPRRRKPSPLFDLPHLPQKSGSQNNHRKVFKCHMKTTPPQPLEKESVAVKNSHFVENALGQGRFVSPLSSPLLLSKTSSPSSQPARDASNKSSPTRSRQNLRGRSPTLNSTKKSSLEEQVDDITPTVLFQTARTSSSTGRKSLGEFFGLSHRANHNADASIPKSCSTFSTPSSNTPKNSSVQITRELPVILPERNEDDTPAKYLIRLEEAVSRGVVASVLSKGNDPFSQAVLRSYMRGFGFFGDPMDMAIRKLLMEVELPKETQQIDRCLQGFANRYHECNPGIYASPDQAYFIAFSLLILHTDVFNKNNKHKMQKSEYLKSTRGEGIFDEILECFYDNISYTPFIHVEDDLDINGERIIHHKMKKRSIFSGNSDSSKRPSKEPVDPYTLIIDNKLDALRPNLKDFLPMEEHYSYLGSAPSLNLSDLQKTFFRTGILQIVSARSRPDAFMSDKTVNNPDEAKAGIVDIKITKVGLLWRKDTKKKKTRSPWQEWGAILTGAQLYFFRNTTWIKSLMHQLELHIKQGNDGTPVTFRPPLDQFKPDALMSTDDSVALLDSRYKKHKNAFLFVRHAGSEETFLADNEYEMNDWLAKLNYAAAFRTSGVRMRGVVGGNYDGQRTRGIRRLDDQKETEKTPQITAGDVSIACGKIDAQMAHDILSARREIMLQKIADAELKLSAAQKQLESQLRNARHLQILAPIQSKTRDNIIAAAGRMAAQLKWGRIRIWRLRCHKEILVMDLEEEKKSYNNCKNESDEPCVLERMELSKNSLSTSNSMSSQSPVQIYKTNDEYVNKRYSSISPTRESASYYEGTLASWGDYSLELGPETPEKSSSGLIAPSTPNTTTVSSKSKLSSLSSDTQRAPSSNFDTAELALLEQAGLFDGAENLIEAQCTENRSDSKDSKEIKLERDRIERGKKRRSFHRAMRDPHLTLHSMSRKSRDYSSGTTITDQDKEETLSRGTGSFVVHGKKASVINFGSELQNFSPEERTQFSRFSYGASRSPASIDDDYHSALAEPYAFHERNGSTATVSSIVSANFWDITQKLAKYCPEETTSEHDDDGSGNNSSDRETALSTMDDHTPSLATKIPDKHCSPQCTAIFCKENCSKLLQNSDIGGYL